MISEKKLVREWARLKYGVFSENPIPGDDEFYIGYENGEAVPLPVGYVFVVTIDVIAYQSMTVIGISNICMHILIEPSFKIYH